MLYTCSTRPFIRDVNKSPMINVSHTSARSRQNVQEFRFPLSRKLRNTSYFLRRIASLVGAPLCTLTTCTDLLQSYELFRCFAFFVFLTFSHRWSSCFDTIFGIQYVGEQQQCPFIIYSIIMSIISLFYFFCFFYFYCLLLYLFEYTMRVFFFLLFFFLRWWRPKTVNRLRITHPIILVHLANSSKPYRHRY